MIAVSVSGSPTHLTLKVTSQVPAYLLGHPDQVNLLTGLLETCITRRLEIQHVFATQTSAMALVGRKLEEGIKGDIQNKKRDFLGIFPKCRTPPLLGTPVFKKKNTAKLYGDALVYPQCLLIS